jgi:DNA-binding NtrC family response regulator
LSTIDIFTHSYREDRLGQTTKKEDSLRLLLATTNPELQGQIIQLLQAEDVEIFRATGTGEVFNKMSRCQPNLIINDLDMPDIQVRELLAESKRQDFFIPVIFLSASDSVQKAVEAMREGAYDYVKTPFNPEDLLIRIRKALDDQRIRNEIQNLQMELRYRRNSDYIIGTNTKILKILGQILAIADNNISVLIQGESGTGKELVARAIHYNSRRSGYPFVAVNCSALPEALIENELFGHVKGAYTGADSIKEGLFDEANLGTIFLDEIAELSLPIQAKFLRILEKGEFRKVGGTETTHVDVRVIAATKKNLTQAIEENKFRDDLFYRLNAMIIELPPLRERKADIPLLVSHFIALFSLGLDKKVEGITDRAIRLLMDYRWPGNIRELENKIKQAMILSRGSLIDSGDLDFKPEPKTKALFSFSEAKRAFEKQYILEVLELANGNVAEAARVAKKDRKDFYEAMKKYGVRAKEFRI